MAERRASKSGATVSTASTLIARRPQEMVERAADRLGGILARQVDMRYLGQAHAPRHRCVRRRARWPSRRKIAPPRFPAPPAPKARWVAAASRLARCRRIRSSACSGARQHRSERGSQSRGETRRRPSRRARRAAAGSGAAHPRRKQSSADHRALCPALPRRVSTAAASTRMRSSPSAKNAPGHGSKART